MSGRLWFRFSVVLVLAISTVWLGNSLKDKTPISVYAAGGTVNISLLPSKLNLPPNGSTQLVLTTGTDKIAATNIEIGFDNTKVKLASEVAVGNTLPYSLPGNTTMAQANASGKLIIHLGKTPGSSIDPTGTFSVATLTWVAATTQTNITTQIVVNTATSTVTDNSDTANPQYVPITATSLTVNINFVATPTPTVTPTPKPTNTPTPQPTSTPIPTPTLIPVTPTPVPPGTLLVIKNVQASRITQTSATISWDLSDYGTGQVEYGKTAAYGLFSTPETSFDWNYHVQILSNLTPKTLYYYRVLSFNANGQKTVSGNYTFTTLRSVTPTPTLKPTSTPIPTSTPVSPTPTPLPMRIVFITAEDKTISYRRGEGNIKALKADGSPVNNFLMKFNVTGLSGRQVTSAILRVYCTDGSISGGRFYSTTNNWSEGSLSWNNAPAAFSRLGYLGLVFPGNWYQVDVTGFVRGEGTYSFRVTSSSWDGVNYSSLEGGHPPQLVVNGN